MSNRLSKEFGLIDGHTYIIGRESEVYLEDHIYINSPSVSRRHAAMKIKNGRIWLRDLNSTNGTYLIGVYSDSKNATSNFEDTRVMPPINKT
jgi:pSer/pThr/pTyr-binding forkhead associated (FHA) protein